MQISYLNKSKLVNTEIKDFVSTNVESDEKELFELKKKKNITIIGLSAFYVILVIVSLFIIT
jgi:hypothetical protein